MQTVTGFLGVCAVGAALLAACSSTSDDSTAQSSQNVVTEPITFNKHVMPILQQQCQICHRDGGNAPFALMNYQQAKDERYAIKYAVVTGDMPEARPIRITTGCSDENTFLGPRRLTQNEIDTIANWVDQGAVEGDPNDLPPPVVFHDPAPGEWTTGTPDVVVQNAPSGFNIPAHNDRDIFRRIPIPTNYDADKYIIALEPKPDNGRWAGTVGTFPIVHHMEIWVDASGKSVQQEQAYQASHPDIEGPGFEGEWDFPETPLLLGMWVPGASPLVAPAGYGYKVPKGAVLVVEMHYAGDRDNEQPVNDRSQWGLHFANAPVKLLNSLVTRNENFVVPANVKGSTAEWSYTYDHPVLLRAITPHEHQLGSDFLVTIERPGEGSSCLADLQWDFEHQNAWWLRTPAKLPAGTKVKWKCTYDNTESAPRQFSHPPIDVMSGRTSRDEMCQMTLHWTDDTSPSEPSLPTSSGSAH